MDSYGEGFHLFGLHLILSILQGFEMEMNADVGGTCHCSVLHTKIVGELVGEVTRNVEVSR